MMQKVIIKFIVVEIVLFFLSCNYQKLEKSNERVICCKNISYNQLLDNSFDIDGINCLKILEILKRGNGAKIDTISEFYHHNWNPKNNRVQAELILKEWDGININNLPVVEKIIDSIAQVDNSIPNHLNADKIKAMYHNKMIKPDLSDSLVIEEYKKIIKQTVLKWPKKCP